ncbi:MAG: hypothetical protein MI867_11545 [Pseudomonadales bacterium]|nr:hypothetical protein [Pseudomonadales bacterium]
MDPELPTSTSADMLEPASIAAGRHHAHWELMQGTLSMGKKEDMPLSETADYRANRGN